MTGDKIWKPLELIKVTAEYLGGKGVVNSRLDAEILLCDIMGLQRRVDLYAGFEREISGKELTAFRELIKKRAAREPVSRILGRREFMGLSFAVTPDVLSPRPETELLVEAALETASPKKPPDLEVAAAVDEIPATEPDAAGEMAEELTQLLDSYAENVDDEEGLDEEAPRPSARAAKRPAPPRAAVPKKGPDRRSVRLESPCLDILDLGTGSGCIAVAIAVHLPGAVVTAIDASPKALAVAKRNAAAAGVGDRVAFRQGDWFAGCRPSEKFDLILSNPPYLVEGDDDIWPEVSAYDPPVALYGGPDGLDCYRRIVPDALDWLKPGGSLLLEVGAEQAGRVADLLKSRGFGHVGVMRDYGGIERVVKGMASSE